MRIPSYDAGNANVVQSQLDSRRLLWPATIGRLEMKVNEPAKSVQINRSISYTFALHIEYMIIFFRYQLLNHRILYFIYFALSPAFSTIQFYKTLLIVFLIIICAVDSDGAKKNTRTSQILFDLISILHGSWYNWRNWCCVLIQLVNDAVHWVTIGRREEKKYPPSILSKI